MTIKNIIQFTLMSMVLAFVGSSCTDLLDVTPENTSITSETDYTESKNIILPMIGAYAEFYTLGWEGIPLISVRGDDLNA